MSKKLLNITAITALITCVFFSQISIAAESESTATYTYTGKTNMEELVKAISFKDVEAMGPGYWAKDAIYEMAALSIIKGNVDGLFKGDLPVTRVQALAMIYRAIGKEAEAKKELDTISSSDNSIDMNVNDPDEWADGYLALAAKEGLLSQEQLKSALKNDQHALNPDLDFIKTKPAQRQEVGMWMAKALGLELGAGELKTIEAFTDKYEIEAAYKPYLESACRENILKGYDGRLNPKGNVSREEMAQMMKNAEKYIYKLRKVEKKVGFIKGITVDNDPKEGQNVQSEVIRISSDGTHEETLCLQRPGNTILPGKTNGQYTDVIVLGAGAPAGSSIIKVNDPVTYLVDANHTVQFIRLVNASDRPARRIEGSSAGAVLCGDIYLYDGTTSILVTDSVRQYKNGQLVPVEGAEFIEVPVDSHTLIYSAGSTLSPEQMNRQLDKKVYLVMGTGESGAQTAKYIVFAGAVQGETMFEGTVTQIGSRDLTIEGVNEKIKYDDTSIIIQKSRIADTDAVQGGDKLKGFLVNGLNGQTNFAAVIIIE